MQSRFILYSLIAIFFIANLSAQENSSYLDRMYDEALEQLEFDYDSSISICQKLLLESRTNNYGKGIYRSQILIGYITDIYLQDKVTALKLYLEVLSQEKGLNYIGKSKDTNLLRIYISTIYLSIEDYQNSIKFLNDNLKEARDLGDNKLVARTLRWLFGPYDKLEDHENALEILNQSQLLNKEIGDKEFEISLHNSKGFTLRELGHHSESINELHKVLNLVKRYEENSSHLRIKAFALTNLAETYMELENYDSAYYYNKIGLDLKDSLGMAYGRDFRSYFYSLHGLAIASSNLDNFDISYSNFLIAERFIENIDATSDRIYLEFYLDFSEFLERNNDYKKSAHIRKKYTDLINKRNKEKEEIETIRLKEEISAVTEDYYRAQEERKTKEQRAELVRLLMYFGIAVLLLVLSYKLYAKIRSSNQLQT